MIYQRSDHAAVRLQDGRVMVIGGSTTGARFDHTTEIYDPSSNRWVLGPELPGARWSFSAAVIGSTVYIFGGAFRGASSSTDAFAWDPSTGVWRVIAPVPMPRANTAIAVVGQRILLIGGDSGTQDYSDRVDIYDSVSGQWSVGPALPAVRRFGTAVTLANGHVMVFGGRSRGLSASITRVDIYDPVMNRWLAGPPISPGRYSIRAVLASNGTVYLAGGSTFSGATAIVSSYSPALNQYDTVSALPSVTTDGALVEAPAGRLLYIGGGRTGEPMTQRVFAYNLNGTSWR